MYGAWWMGMGNTSIESGRPTGEMAGARDHADCCDRCGAPVDLTKAVLFEKDRVVGCPDCTWGSDR
jgi:hypothetical protein